MIIALDMQWHQTKKTGKIILKKKGGTFGGR